MLPWEASDELLIHPQQQPLQVMMPGRAIGSSKQARIFVM